MAKLTKASPDIEKLVQDISEEVISSHLGAVEFKVFCTKKAKEIVKISKASALHEADIERENVINVVVYEEAFDRADAETQRMWIRMALDPIFYDSEKDKTTIDCPKIIVPLGFYQKHGDEACKSAEFAIHTIQQIEDEEKQRKEEMKAMKKSKKK